MEPKIKDSIMTGVVFFIVVIFIIVSLIVLTVYYFADQYNDNCLTNIAKEYCIKHNLTYQDYRSINLIYNVQFACESKVDLRTNPNGEVQYFYYLPEERKTCLVKKFGSF